MKLCTVSSFLLLLSAACALQPPSNNNNKAETPFSHKGTTAKDPNKSGVRQVWPGFAEPDPFHGGGTAQPVGGGGGGVEPKDKKNQVATGVAGVRQTRSVPWKQTRRPRYRRPRQTQIETNLAGIRHPGSAQGGEQSR